MRLGLERIAALLRRLGDPQRRLRVCHVAGTNGKGSTAAALASILRAAGYHVGLYTSPHLEGYEERVRINGRRVSSARLDRALAAVAEAVGPGLDGERPTPFEAVTAAAYLLFAAAGVDVVVQETGLGGRLDATNVVEEPEVVILTPISLDHTDRLGRDLELVAAEKVAVIKRGSPVVTGRQEERVLSLIGERASALGCPLRCLGSHFQPLAARVTWEGTGFDLRLPDRLWRDLFLPLPGRHQADNAACAVAACELLAVRGWRVDETAVRRGLAATRWLGRLETVRRRPRVVLDVAHNPAGAAALAAALRELAGGSPVVLVVGLLGDKDAAGFLAALAGLASSLILTGTRGTRGRSAAELAAVAESLARGGCPVAPSVVVAEDAAAALRTAAATAGPGGVVCVTGSFTLVGEARRLLAAGRRGWAAIGFP